MQQDVFKSLLPLTNCLLSLLMLADKLSILSFVHICSFVNQKSEIKKKDVQLATHPFIYAGVNLIYHIKLAQHKSCFYTHIRYILVIQRVGNSLVTSVKNKWKTTIQYNKQLKSIK